MKAPLVSIVVPAHNSAHTIAATLDSVAAQTFRDFEVIVVDDASSDGTAEAVRGWGEVSGVRCQVSGGKGGGGWKVEGGEGNQRPTSNAQRPTSKSDENDGTRSMSEASNTPILQHSNAAASLPCLHLLRQQRNTGPAGARNRGIREAHGEWIAFLDADDLWRPDKLEIQVACAAAHPEVDLWCGGVETFRGEVESGGWKVEGGEGDQHPPSTVLLPLSSFAVANPVNTSTVLVRKRVLEEAGGFDEAFRGPEDYDLWIRVAAGRKAARIERILTRYRLEEGSLSMDDRKFLPQVLRVLDKAYGRGGALEGHPAGRRARAYQILSCSWMAARRGALSRAWALFVRSLLWWPWSFAPFERYPLARAKLVYFFLRRMGRVTGNRVIE